MRFSTNCNYTRDNRTRNWSTNRASNQFCFSLLFKSADSDYHRQLCNYQSVLQSAVHDGRRLHISFLFSWGFTLGNQMFFLLILGPGNLHKPVNFPRIPPGLGVCLWDLGQPVLLNRYRRVDCLQFPDKFDGSSWEPGFTSAMTLPASRALTIGWSIILWFNVWPSESVCISTSKSPWWSNVPNTPSNILVSGLSMGSAWISSTVSFLVKL